MNIWKKQRGKHHPARDYYEPDDDTAPAPVATHNPRPCVVCDGTGEVETTKTVRGEVVTVMDTCPACGGDGRG